MRYSIGQHVVFLHEEGGGKIISFENGIYTVQDEVGFNRKYRESELGEVHSFNHKLDEIEISEPNLVQSKKGSRSVPNNWEIDLHIEELVDSHAHMTNYEIVQKQLLELRKFVAKAQEKKIRKIVVIHGVGTGVLRSEVRNFFQPISGAEFFDGDYKEYGQGATVVLLRYKY
jgi:hypothetical protein